MKRIGLLSDTHGYWDERYLKYFDTCDEIWHAGDIGSQEVADRLAAFRPLRAVYGNIDGQDMRLRFRNQPLPTRRSRRTDETYWGISGEVRPFRPADSRHATPATVYQRTLPHPKSKI